MRRGSIQLSWPSGCQGPRLGKESGAAPFSCLHAPQGVRTVPRRSSSPCAFLAQHSTSDGSPDSLANNTTKRRAKTYRSKQRRFQASLNTFTLEGAIDNINLPLYGGGPSLVDHIMGMQQPFMEEPLFYGVDQSPTTQNLTYLPFQKQSKATPSIPSEN